jgi:hypothetical protein
MAGQLVVEREACEYSGMDEDGDSRIARAPGKCAMKCEIKLICVLQWSAWSICFPCGSGTMMERPDDDRSELRAGLMGSWEGAG